MDTPDTPQVAAIAAQMLDLAESRGCYAIVFVVPKSEDGGQGVTQHNDKDGGYLFKLLTRAITRAIEHFDGYQRSRNLK